MGAGLDLKGACDVFPAKAAASCPGLRWDLKFMASLKKTVVGRDVVNGERRLILSACLLPGPNGTLPWPVRARV